MERVRGAPHSDAAEPLKEQFEITERLQLKMLERWEKLLDDGELSPTDAATLTRFLSQNGWVLDPAKLPQSLRDKLTSKVGFDSDLAEEPKLRVV